MAYLTESQIRRYSESYELRRRASQYLCESTTLARVTVFLSHSHLDRDLAEGMILLLASFDIAVSVDWNDNGMPRETSRETADKIKDRIATLKLFMVLATKNALNSKWIPWEVGIADKTKGKNQVLIIPVVDFSDCFDGSEYLRLYNRLVVSEQGNPAVFEPGKTTDGRLLENYMKLFGR